MALREYIKQRLAEGGEVETPEAEPVAEPAPVAAPAKKQPASPVGALAADPKSAEERDSRLRAYYNKQLEDVRQSEGSFGNFTGIDSVLRKYGSLSPEGQRMRETGLEDEFKSNQLAKQQAAAGLSDLDTQKAAVGSRTQFNDLMKQAQALPEGDPRKKALIDQAINIDPVQYNAIATARKPEAEIKKLDADAQKKIADAAGVGAPGFDRKTGNFTTESGTVIKGTEVSKDREERQKLDDGARRLKSLTAAEVKNSLSAIDYTGAGSTGALGKTLGNFTAEKTQAAQIKVYNTVIDSLLKALPPGPASDKDVQNAKATFPGFGNKKALEEWVDAQRTTIDSHVGNFKNKYGNDRWYGETGFKDSDTGSGKTPGAAPGGEKKAPAADLPPISVLKEGVGTRFGDGSVWTLRGGVQTRVS